MKNPIKAANQEREDLENKLDSTVNTDGANIRNNDGKSLTNDESGDVDPNAVADKPSFTSSDEDKARDSGKFDGKIGI